MKIETESFQKARLQCTLPSAIIAFPNLFLVLQKNCGLACLIFSLVASQTVKHKF